MKNTNITMINILLKLPQHLQDELQSELAHQTTWSPQWEQWAQSILLELHSLKDNDIITRTEWESIYNTYFSMCNGGKLGPETSNNIAAFTDYVRYYAQQSEFSSQEDLEK